MAPPGIKSSEIVCIHWKDACHSMEEYAVSDLGGLVDLYEVGFLLREDDTSVTISLESDLDQTSTRLWLTIPRANIVEMRRTTVGRAFPDKRIRKTRSTEIITA